MAGRLFKQGLDYFPLKVDFFRDDRIQLIEAEFGYKGLVVTIQLLCKIYQQGYYYQWGEDQCLLLSKASGGELSPEKVQEIVEALVKRRYFDPQSFASYKILTDSFIQQVYLEAAGRRKQLEIISEYWLLGKTDETNIQFRSIDDDINRINAPMNEQRKGKERKTKEKKLSTPNVVDHTCKNPDSCTTTAEKTEKELKPVEVKNRPKVNYEELVSQFNEITQGVFGNVRLPIHATRRKMLKARLCEFGSDSFVEMLHTAMNSNFLKGDNRRGFKATFDWMIRPSNYQKIIEGNYANSKNQVYATDRKLFTTATERVRAESEQLKQELAAKYGQDYALRNESAVNDALLPRSTN